MSSDRWLELVQEGNFRVTYPAEASYSLLEEGTLLEIRIRGSAVHIACHPLPGTGERPTKEFLERQVRRFCDECIPGGVKPSYTIVTTRNPDQESITSQAVALGESGRWWVVRGVALEHSNQWFLISWNGERSLLSVPVLEILESFVPLA